MASCRDMHTTIIDMDESYLIQNTKIVHNKFILKNLYKPNIEFAGDRRFSRRCLLMSFKRQRRENTYLQKHFLN